MSQASPLKNITPTPGEMTLDIVSGILDDGKMDIHTELGALRELSVERIFFDSPQQAIEIISGLAEIIASAPEPEVRVAALEAMERMIVLEEKAETELGRESMNWRKVNVLLHKARKQTADDMAPVASRLAPPSPEVAVALRSTPSKDPAIKGSAAAPTPAAEIHPISGDDESGNVENISRAEAALLAAQEAAVEAIHEGNPPVVPPPQNSAGLQPVTGKRPTADISPAQRTGLKPVETELEPPIMKFLRALAGTNTEEESVRALANRIIANIEALTTLKPSAARPPAPTEG